MTGPGPKAKPEHVRFHVGYWGDERNCYKWDQSVAVDPQPTSGSTGHLIKCQIESVWPYPSLGCAWSRVDHHSVVTTPTSSEPGFYSSIGRGSASISEVAGHTLPGQSPKKSCICSAQPGRKNPTECENKLMRERRTGLLKCAALIRSHRRDVAIVDRPGTGRTGTAIEKRHLSQYRARPHQSQLPMLIPSPERTMTSSWPRSTK